MRTALGILSLLWKCYIALIFGLTALIFYPIIVPQLGSEAGKRRAFRWFVIWSWTVRILCFYPVRRKMDNPLPEAPYIIVANHSSYLDIFLIPSILPNHPFLFMGKSEILKYPLIKTYFKRMNIPVHRSNPVKAARSLVKAAQEVKLGWSLMIFPEGGIPDEGSPRMVPFKDGAFQLAKSVKIAIVPVTFTNNYRLFSDPGMPLGPARPGTSHVYIHPFISAEQVMTLSQEELKQRCFDIINGPLQETHPDLRNT